jgi:hypothetical protein
MDESNNCCICEVELKNVIQITLTCKHVFCYNCIHKWKEREEKNTCPTCRAEFPPEPEPEHIANPSYHGIRRRQRPIVNIRPEQLERIENNAYLAAAIRVITKREQETYKFLSFTLLVFIILTIIAFVISVMGFQQMLINESDIENLKLILKNNTLFYSLFFSTLLTFTTTGIN